jgi:hypothetical protein
VPYRHGDQTGRIFAHWAIVVFGQLNENYRSNANSLATTFQSTSYVCSKFAKNGLATFRVTLSQGHRASQFSFILKGNFFV